MKLLSMIIGILVLVTGFFWIGQGLGYIKWPTNSFMISQVKWTYYGVIVAIIGVLIIGFTYIKK